MTKIDLPKSSKELIIRLLHDCEQPEDVNQVDGKLSFRKEVGND